VGFAPRERMRTDVLAEIRRLTEEIELEVHLARMEARERWSELQPKLREVGAAAGRTVAHEAAALAAQLKTLRDEISDELHGAPAVWQ